MVMRIPPTSSARTEALVLGMMTNWANNAAIAMPIIPIPTTCAVSLPVNCIVSMTKNAATCITAAPMVETATPRNKKSRMRLSVIFNGGKSGLARGRFFPLGQKQSNRHRAAKRENRNRKKRRQQMHCGQYGCKPRSDDRPHAKRCANGRDTSGTLLARCAVSDICLRRRGRAGTK